MTTASNVTSLRRSRKGRAVAAPEERSIEDIVAEIIANGGDGGIAWEPPTLLKADDANEDIFISLYDEDDSTFNTFQIDDDIEEFVEVLRETQRIKRAVVKRRVTVSLIDFKLSDKYDRLFEQLVEYMQGCRFTLMHYRDQKNTRRALMLIPHTGVSVAVTDEFSAKLLDVIDPLRVFRGDGLDFENKSVNLGYVARVRKVEQVQNHNGHLLDGFASAAHWGLQTSADCLDDDLTPKDIQQAPDKGRLLIDGMVQIGDYGVIYSPPNTGKTTFAVYLGFCVANGMEVLGFMRSKRAHVIYADLEFNNIDGMLLACEEQHGARIGWRDRFHLVNNLPDLGNDAAVDAWCAKMRAKTNGEPTLVIIDTQRKAARNSTLAGQPLKENGNDDMTVIANAMMRISCRMNGATFSLHHTTKANEEVMSGGGALEAGVTSAFVLTVPDKSKPNCLNFAATKRRGNGMPKGIYYGIELVDVRIMTEDEEKMAIDDLDAWFSETIKADCHKAPEYGMNGASFDTGPQTHAKTVYPKLFDAFEVKRGAISANAVKQEQKRDDIAAAKEFILNAPSPVCVADIREAFGISKSSAQRYIETLLKDGSIACVEKAEGRKPNRYGSL